VFQLLTSVVHALALSVIVQRPNGWFPEKPRQLQHTTVPGLPQVVVRRRPLSSRRQVAVTSVTVFMMRRTQPRYAGRVAVGPQSHWASTWVRTERTTPVGHWSRPITTERRPMGGPGAPMGLAGCAGRAKRTTSTVAIGQMVGRM
jgi:hypothetical protein